MLGGCLKVFGSGVPRAVVCGVALHDSAVHESHKFLYHVYTKMVRIATFAGRQLYGYIAMGFASEHFIYSHEILGIDSFAKIYFWLIHDFRYSAIQGL